MPLAHPELTPRSNRIIGCAIEVHRELGPGLLESIYEECLEVELHDAGFAVSRQRQIPVVYKKRKLSSLYRCDLIVDELIMIEVKAVDAVLGVHSAQLLTYMRLSAIELGFLFNFNSETVVGGMKRLIL